VTGLLGYLRWHIRDALLGPVLSSTVIAGGIAGIMIYAGQRVAEGQVLQSPEFAAQVVSQAMGIFALLGGFGVVANTIGGDRREAYYRFLFSKAVAVPAYYAQLLVVRFTLLLGAAALFALALRAFVPVERVAGAVAGVALVAGLTVGVGTLAGALTQREAGVLVAGFLGATILHTAREALGPVMRGVYQALPPWGQAQQLREALQAGRPVGEAELTLVIGYAVGAFALGLLAARRLPLAR
jgi:hypothetical protein